MEIVNEKNMIYRRSYVFVLALFIISFSKLGAQVFFNGKNSIITSQGSPSISLNEMNFLNDGLIQLTDSELIINGSEDIFIEGSIAPNFHDLIVNVSGNLIFDTNVTVNNQLILENGDVDLQNHNLILPKNESRLIGEDIKQRVLSSGSGEIIKYSTLKTLKNENVGNLGLLFTQFENSDTLLIKRGHSTLPVPFGESITRYYYVLTKKKHDDKIEIGIEYFDNEIIVRDPEMVEQIWVQNSGEWNHSKANISRKPQFQSNLVRAEVELYESVITLGLYKKLINESLIPNSFTPNNDGVNDYFVIPEIEQLPSAVVRIYNNYGKLLYTQKNYQRAPWDGTFQGNIQPFGHYLYQIIDDQNPLEFIEGEISIIK